jgi:16S rRNA (guanine966-N2)-methyltransferase
VTRIIAGTAKGRRLKTPPGDRTRPTSDRVREALFSSVEAWAGSLSGLHVLDLYAGSGAVGLEALSRGAASATLVESHGPTAALIRGNARDLGLAGAEVVHAPVVHALVRPYPHRFDLVFSDPPYDLPGDDLAGDLALLLDLVAPGALVVVERSRRTPTPWFPPAYEPGRTKRYGETTLWYGHAP